MGSQQSEFEQRFHQVYVFIQLLDDPFFEQIKIYRKTKYNYDYMMVIERELSSLSPSNSTGRQPIQEKIELIRNYQNNFTTKIEHYRILTGRKLDCEVPFVRLYAEYQNHTLQDYLSALRGKRIPISLEEIVYVLRAISSGILTLRKMRIHEFDLSLSNIFISIQGNVRLNPAYLLIKSFTIRNSQHVVKSLNRDYLKYSLTRGVIQGNSRRETSADITRLWQQNQRGTQMKRDQSYFMKERETQSRKRQPHGKRQGSLKLKSNEHGQFLNFRHRDEQTFEFQNLKNIQTIFLQLTRYLSIQTLPQSASIHSTIQKVESVGELLAKLPNTKCQELFVEQFISPGGESSGQLFAT